MGSVESEAAVSARKKSGGNAFLGYGLLLSVSALLGATCAVAVRFAHKVLTPAAKPDDRIEVLSLEGAIDSPTGQRVWLCGPEADLEGNLSFIFDAYSRAAQHLAGHARLGPVTETVGTGAHKRISREVISIERGDLRVGARGRVTGWWYTDPSQLGYPARRVSIPLPDGVGWGWVIAPTNADPERWAVHVHGRGALPHETLRGVEVFAEAGISSLVIAYRNDQDAPPGIGGRYGLGLAEQYDVDAAVGWTRSQGARRVTLVGWSMGGTAAVLAAAQGSNAHTIDGLVLDSPALDWADVLRQQARLARLPRVFAELGMLILQCGWVRGAVPGERGTDLMMLSGGRLAASIRVPTLIHVSAEDTFVPWRGALQAARTRPSLVRLHLARGEHVKLWNVDPRSWQAETAKFLSTLRDPRPSSGG